MKNPNHYPSTTLPTIISLLPKYTSLSYQVSTPLMPSTNSYHYTRYSPTLHPFPTHHSPSTHPLLRAPTLILYSLLDLAILVPTINIPHSKIILFLPSRFHIQRNTFHEI